MRPHRAIPIILSILALVGCGRITPRTFDERARPVVRPAPVLDPHSGRVRVAANPIGAASLALAVRADEQRAWLAAVATGVEAQKARERVPVRRSAPPSAPRASGAIDWPCVAVAETGADWTMHGAVYSTAYGVINDIVREYASPEVAARIFSGTASEAEQTDIVARFAADHGTGGWGVTTKAKCGL